jgi:tRNA U54 and U55 pseudouridine synthase Pus10
MYGYCEKCKDVCFTQNKTDQNLEIEWSQWITKKEKRMIKSEEKEITVTVKENTNAKVGNIIDLFTDQIVRLKVHTYNVGNQLKYYRLIKENLKENEALLHIDFAENFQTKLSREIQSMHFGASHNQITIHTGVYSQVLCNNFRFPGSQPTGNLGLSGACT